MNPMMSPILIGGLVIAMVVLLYLAFGKDAGEAAADRLDALVGRNGRKDSSADMLLKQALQEADKKTLLDRLTPEFFNLHEDVRAGRLQHQAQRAVRHRARAGRARRRPCACWLVNIYVVPVGAVLFFALPWLWLYNKRADAAEEVRRPAARRAGTGRPGACGPATRWPPACTSSPRKCPPPISQGVRPRLRGAEPRHPARRGAEGHVRPRAEPRPALLRHQRRRSSGRPVATWRKSSTRSATSSASASGFSARSRR